MKVAAQPPNHLYDVWRGMRRRCYDLKHKSYHRYGGRGIQICSDWLSFRNFERWALNSGYAFGLQLDRIDNDGDYCAENCRWVTPKENANNRSDNHYISFNGVTHTLTEWSELLDIPNNILRNRITTLRWSAERAFTQPIIRRKRHENHRAKCSAH